MENLEKLKEYIQHELDNIKGNTEELMLDRTQLLLFVEEIDDLFTNVELNSFSSVFDKYSFNITFDKVNQAISLIRFFNQLNTTDIPQYQNAFKDLQELQKRANEFIKKIEEQIQVTLNNQEKITILEEGLNILNNNEINYIFTEEELNKLFDIIKLLPLSLDEKYDLIRVITSKNIENKLLRKVDNALTNSNDDLLSISIEDNLEEVNELLNATDELDETSVSDLSEEEISEDDVNEPLLSKIQEIINHLSKYYEIQQFDVINNETGILERKVIYSSNNEISKYNWPLIYADLCNNLLPKYKNGENKEEIKELFEFIIEKYLNYESVSPELENDTIKEIENYFNIINGVEEKEIKILYRNIENFTNLGLECNLSEVLGRDIPYTNEQIIFYYKIFELNDAYNMYKQARENEVKNRFSPSLANCITEINDCKEWIEEMLADIRNKEKATIIDEIIDDEDEIIEELDEDENIHYLTNEEPCNLVIFASNNSDGFVNIVDEIISQGNNQITLRNIINAIYIKHYMCSNYIGIPKNKHTGYRYLEPNKKYKNLEFCNMYRSRKGDVRCAYYVVPVSEYNKRIIQNSYPNFNGVLFLVTGVFYKPSDKTNYIGDTNKFLGDYYNEMDSIINLFKNDFESHDDINRALSFIDNSITQYNNACSLVDEKKVGGK